MTAAPSPRFTIVTPVMNGLRWIEECVRSVAAQRADVDVEHTILDPGSVDGTREWLAQNRALGYRAILEPDRGQTHALIKGFDAAQGELLGWLNADDVLEPHALARVSEAFASNPEIVMTSGCCLLMNEHGGLIGMITTPPHPTFRGLLMHQENPAQPATFFSAAAYRRVGGLEERYDLAMDVDLWLKLSRVGPVSFLSSDVLARFRVHQTAKSVVGLTRAIRQDFHIRRSHGMPLRSEAAHGLIMRGYVRPALRPAKRAVVSAARRLAVSEGPD